MCEWNRIDEGMPDARDRWYLFGGIDDNGEFSYRQMHYSMDGSVDGLALPVILRRGYTHWCAPLPPAHNKLWKEAE